ncbi:lysine--tRNA ligase, mitochondrial [Trichomonascus vanleenenianus]|uniref:lysine--tRNA ligase MSK1 n=1 Tax=Trichomonascus vanleenenianus TaxID=2268995 RepID=UPI003EC9C54B
MSRWYSKSVYENKKSTLTSDNEAADFAARNSTLLTEDKAGKRPLYPLIDSMIPRGNDKLRLREFKRRYEPHTEHTSDPVVKNPVVISGRIESIRRAGKGLLFVDIVQDSSRVQIVVNLKRLAGYGIVDKKEANESHRLLRRGDHVIATGFPWRTKSGEFSLLADRTIQLASPCLHPLPTNLVDQTTRQHNRVVDFIVNKEAREIILIRSTVIACIRQFLTGRGFLEVQTPMISTRAGGAAASPFTTSSTALSSDGKSVNLALRIAPELWLKRLVVSGFEQVFEIGQCFRNEGIDATHNPEFTTCEFYQSYTSLDELINLTESMLRDIVNRVTDSYPSLQAQLTTLSPLFTQPFKRIDFIGSLESITRQTLPEELTIDNLIAYCNEVRLPESDELSSSADIDAAQLLDKLAGHFLEPLCQEPTFIINHPQVMAPLAKSTTVIINGIPRRISRRFELFIQEKEYANAYEEENSPHVQLQNFMEQENTADPNAISDIGYVDALKWGLPPTGGWGLGIDRLCMLLTGSKRIEQVLTFGGVKTVNYQ